MVFPVSCTFNLGLSDLGTSSDGVGLPKWILFIFFPYHIYGTDDTTANQNCLYRYHKRSIPSPNLSCTYSIKNNVVGPSLLDLASEFVEPHHFSFRLSGEGRNYYRVFWLLQYIKQHTALTKSKPREKTRTPTMAIYWSSISAKNKTGTQILFLTDEYPNLWERIYKKKYPRCKKQTSFLPKLTRAQDGEWKVQHALHVLFPLRQMNIMYPSKS